MSMVPTVWRQPFPEDEIPFILAAIVRCMAMVRKKEPCEYENPITTRLWKKLVRDAEFNARPTHLDPETWELNEENENGKIGRLDLRVLFSTGTLKPWPCFAIEAKRLHVTLPSGWKSLVSEYVTSNTTKRVEDEQGMMCFVSGRYSRGLCAGAMLGYVFDGDVAAAHAAIAAAIQTHAEKLRIIAGSRLTNSSILPRGSGVRESLHELVEAGGGQDFFRRRFVIYHLLVPV